MLKWAMLGLAVVLGTLLALSLMPEREQVVPESDIALSGVSLTLFPQTDPDARWQFEADAATYQPSSREAFLHAIRDGGRLVGERLDFSLCAEQVHIDNRDNLLSPLLFVQFIDENIDMEMRGIQERQVLIDQGAGRFEIPRLNWTGEGLGENSGENVLASFDLATFEVSNPRYQFIDGGTDYVRENLCRDF